jgi:hypothetical protein
MIFLSFHSDLLLPKGIQNESDSRIEKSWDVTRYHARNRGATGKGIHIGLYRL